MPTLRALVTFAGPNHRFVNEGDLVDASDPIVSGREQLFESVDRATAAPAVEQATAAPGEKRTTSRKGASKKGD